MCQCGFRCVYIRFVRSVVTFFFVAFVSRLVFVGCVFHWWTCYPFALHLGRFIDHAYFLKYVTKYMEFEVGVGWGRRFVRVVCPLKYRSEQTRVWFTSQYNTPCNFIGVWPHFSQVFFRARLYNLWDLHMSLRWCNFVNSRLRYVTRDDGFVSVNFQITGFFTRSK